MTPNPEQNLQMNPKMYDEDDKRDGADAIDCEIDDPELLGTKKHLTVRGQPLTFIESLKGKHKTLSF
jgi:hypothetical protein